MRTRWKVLGSILSAALLGLAGCAEHDFGPVDSLQYSGEDDVTVVSVAGGGNDADQDGVPDTDDNCPHQANPAQDDVDGDWYGDICDACPDVDDPEQTDDDADGIGDACDDDIEDPDEDDSDNDSDSDSDDSPFDDWDGDGDGTPDPRDPRDPTGPRDGRGTVEPVQPAGPCEGFQDWGSNSDCQDDRVEPTDATPVTAIP